MYSSPTIFLYYKNIFPILKYTTKETARAIYLMAFDLTVTLKVKDLLPIII